MKYYMLIYDEGDIGIWKDNDEKPGRATFLCSPLNPKNDISYVTDISVATLTSPDPIDIKTVVSENLDELLEMCTLYAL